MLVHHKHGCSGLFNNKKPMVHPSVLSTQQLLPAINYFNSETKNRKKVWFFLSSAVSCKETLSPLPLYKAKQQFKECDSLSWQAAHEKVYNRKQLKFTSHPSPIFHYGRFQLTCPSLPCYQCPIFITSPTVSPIIPSRSIVTEVLHLSQMSEIPIPDFFPERRNMIFPNLNPREGHATCWWLLRPQNNLALTSPAPGTCCWCAHANPFLPAAYHLIS